jgi:hypothetical protein
MAAVGGVGIASGVGGREAEGPSNYQNASRRSPEPPLRSIGGGGDCGGRGPGAFAVVASAEREVGAPRSGGVVVVIHTATGGVADITPTKLNGHPIDMGIGSGLPLQPRCEAQGLEVGTPGGGGGGPRPVVVS